VQREKSKEPQIAGAFGTIREHDDDRRRGVRARLLTLIAIIGPGLIVMIGDNDAGGVSTYAQAGQNFGYSLLWTLPLLIPVLIVIQEMVARLGAVTGVGVEQEGLDGGEADVPRGDAGQQRADP